MFVLMLLYQVRTMLGISLYTDHIVLPIFLHLLLLWDHGQMVIAHGTLQSETENLYWTLQVADLKTYSKHAWRQNVFSKNICKYSLLLKTSLNIWLQCSVYFKFMDNMYIMLKLFESYFISLSISLWNKFFWKETRTRQLWWVVTEVKSKTTGKKWVIKKVTEKKEISCRWVVFFKILLAFLAPDDSFFPSLFVHQDIILHAEFLLLRYFVS